VASFVAGGSEKISPSCYSRMRPLSTFNGHSDGPWPRKRTEKDETRSNTIRNKTQSAPVRRKC
jgi:hypothetical protein